MEMLEIAQLQRERTEKLYSHLQQTVAAIDYTRFWNEEEPKSVSLSIYRIIYTRSICNVNVSFVVSRERIFALVHK